MSLYVIIMHCLSLVGFYILFFSFSLLIFVPTKLDNFTRFVIHGHDLTSALTQLYTTLGTIPTFVFPCASGYVSGLLSDFGIEPLDQMNVLVTLMTITKSFTLLLTINRVFAINTWMKKHKNPVLIIFFALLVVQVVVTLVNGSNTKDGKEAQLACLAMITYEYPIEMYTFRGYDVSLQDENDQLTSIIVGLHTIITMIIAIVCVSILIRSIKEQAKSSQSTQFLANQRRITSGILCFTLVEFLGLFCPYMIFTACFALHIGNTVVSDCCYIAMCIYPIFGPYYVLMSNMDYRKRVRGILQKGTRESLTEHLSIQLRRKDFHIANSQQSLTVRIPSTIDSNGV